MKGFLLAANTVHANNSKESLIREPLVHGFLRHQSKTWWATNLAKKHRSPMFEQPSKRGESSVFYITVCDVFFSFFLLYIFLHTQGFSSLPELLQPWSDHISLPPGTAAGTHRLCWDEPKHSSGCSSSSLSP